MKCTQMTVVSPCYLNFGKILGLYYPVESGVLVVVHTKEIGVRENGEKEAKGK